MKRLIFKTSFEWVAIFRNELPDIYNIIIQSQSISQFCKKISSYIDELEHNFTIASYDAFLTIKRMLLYEGSYVKECSEEDTIYINTFEHLWRGIKYEPNFNSPAFYIEIYTLFKELSDGKLKDRSDNDSLIGRWNSGYEKNIVSQMKRNKDRIIQNLIEDISAACNKNSKYSFSDLDSDADKKRKVIQWWSDYRFHLSKALTHPDDIDRYLGYTLPRNTMLILRNAKEKGIPFFITPYYLSLIDCNKQYDDSTLRDHIIYSQELVENFGNIKAWEREDDVRRICLTDVVKKEYIINHAGWILPDKALIHRRYPEVAILIPPTRGRACGGLCAYCQRMYGFQSGVLNFDFQELSPKKGWIENLKDSLRYFEEDAQLRDILITGGDALMSNNETLNIIFNEVYEMAIRKIKSNDSKNEKYASLQRIRLGTKLPVYLPFRIDDRLCEILSEFRKKALKIGITQFFIQTHFQTPLELTPDTIRAINKLNKTGWTITNQSVFTVSASRKGHVARLRRELNKFGVITYYTFAVKGFEENQSLLVPNSRLAQERNEEKIKGIVNKEHEEKLKEIFNEKNKKEMECFMKKENLKFLATDRNIMNLPGIGKSLSFKTIALDRFGCRILSFDYDKNRSHSPAIISQPQIIIRERRSNLSYLMALHDKGEDIDNYNSIWNYRNSTTEDRFPFFNYPEQEFEITTKITNSIYGEYPTS